MRLRTALARASFDSEPRRGSAGGDVAVKAATTSPSRKTIAPSPLSISIDK